MLGSAKALAEVQQLLMIPAQMAVHEPIANLMMGISCPVMR